MHFRHSATASNENGWPATSCWTAGCSVAIRFVSVPPPRFMNGAWRAAYGSRAADHRPRRCARVRQPLPRSWQGASNAPDRSTRCSTAPAASRARTDKGGRCATARPRTPSTESPVAPCSLTARFRNRSDSDRDGRGFGAHEPHHAEPVRLRARAAAGAEAHQQRRMVPRCKASEARSAARTHSGGDTQLIAGPAADQQPRALVAVSNGDQLPHITNRAAELPGRGLAGQRPRRQALGLQRRCGRRHKRSGHDDRKYVLHAPVLPARRSLARETRAPLP